MNKPRSNLSGGSDPKSHRGGLPAVAAAQDFRSGTLFGGMLDAVASRQLRREQEHTKNNAGAAMTEAKFDATIAIDVQEKVILTETLR